MRNHIKKLTHQSQPNLLYRLGQNKNQAPLFQLHLIEQALRYIVELNYLCLISIHSPTLVSDIDIV